MKTISNILFADDDVFYDLGSGYGRVVRAIIKGTHTRKSAY